MERSRSFGLSWADQWDSGDDGQARNGSSGGGGGKKGGAEKVKAKASTGLKKVKTGTALGLQWIKDKYHKTTQKH